MARYPHIRPLYRLLLDAYEALGQSDKAAEEHRHLLEPKLIVVSPVKDAPLDELLSLCCSSTRLLKEAGLLSRFGHPNQAIEVARRAMHAGVEPWRFARLTSKASQGSLRISKRIDLFSEHTPRPGSSHLAVLGGRQIRKGHEPVRTGPALLRVCDSPEASLFSRTDTSLVSPSTLS